MTLATLLLLVAGLVLLVLGGEFLVRGAARLAALAGISPLVVGLTIVAWGTSAPEMAVSIRAGFAGNDAIAVANVVGSNIFNVLFILGACAALAPLIVNRRLVRIDVPVMIAVSLAAGFFALDGKVALWEGALLAVGAIGYTVWSLRANQAPAEGAAAAGGEGDDTPADPAGLPWTLGFIALALVAGLGWRLAWFDATEAGLAVFGALVFLIAPLLGRADLARQIGFVFAGLGILVVGAGWLVESAVTLARGLGVSDAVIGLTIVAAGTSLPEVAASIIATIRGQRDIAIGNVVGSNIANILAILGVSSLVTPGGLSVSPEMLRVDIPVMIGIAIICLPAFYTGYLIRRWEGFVFLAAYIGYTTYLVLSATGHAWTTSLGEALGYVFVPVVLAAFAVTGFHALFTRRRRRAAGAA